MELLKSKAPIIPVTANSQWKDVGTFHFQDVEKPQAYATGVQVKRSLVKDTRYDAVGSSTLREELFNTFLKALASSSLSSNSATAIYEEASPNVPVETKTDRKERREKALRDRREQARLDRERIEEDIGRSKAVLTAAESETELMSFFVDAVREPTVCFPSKLSHRPFLFIIT
jgi:transcription elongation regulator 1